MILLISMPFSPEKIFKNWAKKQANILTHKISLLNISLKKLILPPLPLLVSADDIVGQSN